MGDYGGLTEHAVGVLLKEMVRRAIEAIQARQIHFEVAEKSTSYGSQQDIVTSADRAAQEIYLGMIRECLPGYGIIAEEDELREACTVEPRSWLTVDPLDGTRAFVRRQSQGIGTMIALVRDSEVVSAYVGDVLTREIYGYRPESTSVHRIRRYSLGVRLSIDRARPISSQSLLLHTEPRRFSEHARSLFEVPATRAFGSFEITSGSVGLAFARLWKAEVGGILTMPGRITPWDFCPLLGISKKLGFVFLAVRSDGLVPVELPIIRDFYTLEDEHVVVHESRIEEICEVYDGKG